MNKSENPIAIQSREMITNALLQLMLTKKYSDITVTEIVEKADLVRKTFYRNFSSKDDVLAEYIRQLFQGYVLRLLSLKEFTPYTAVQTYFEFCLEHFSFLKLLKDNQLLFYLLKLYDDFLPFIDEHIQKSKLPESVYDYSIAYSAGGFWRLLCKWIEKGGQDSPKEMAAMFVQYFTT